MLGNRYVLQGGGNLIVGALHGGQPRLLGGLDLQRELISLSGRCLLFTLSCLDLLLQACQDIWVVVGKVHDGVADFDLLAFSNVPPQHDAAGASLQRHRAVNGVVFNHAADPREVLLPRSERQDNWREHEQQQHDAAKAARNATLAGELQGRKFDCGVLRCGFCCGCHQRDSSPLLVAASGASSPYADSHSKVRSHAAITSGLLVAISTVHW